MPGSTFEWTLISGGKHDAPFTYYSSQGDYKAAGLVRDSRGESYVFIDVEPRLPDSMFDACNPPTGAKPSPCRQYVAPDGSVVSESTFKTSGGNIQYVVTVERPDGTSVGAMETNSLPGADPVTRSEPNVTAAQLAALGLELTAYPPGYPRGETGDVHAAQAGQATDRWHPVTAGIRPRPKRQNRGRTGVRGGQSRSCEWAWVANLGVVP